MLEDKSRPGAPASFAAMVGRFAVYVARLVHRPLSIAGLSLQSYEIVAGRADPASTRGGHVNVGHGCRYVTATRMPHGIKLGDEVSYQILRNGIALDSIAKELASWSLLQHLHGILNYAR